MSLSRYVFAPKELCDWSIFNNPATFKPRERIISISAGLKTSQPTRSKLSTEELTNR